MPKCRFERFPDLFFRRNKTYMQAQDSLWINEEEEDGEHPKYSSTQSDFLSCYQ